MQARVHIGSLQEEMLGQGTVLRRWEPGLARHTQVHGSWSFHWILSSESCGLNAIYG